MSHLGYGNWWSNDTRAGTSQSLIPNLLGFSLGTYAILFSLMTGRFKHAPRVVKNGQDVTLLNGINVTFFHVILVQVSALFDLVQAIQPHSPAMLPYLPY